LVKSKETKENPKKRKIASETASEAILLNPKNQRNFFIQRIEKYSPCKGGMGWLVSYIYSFLWISLVSLSLEIMLSVHLNPKKTLSLILKK
jgi:hypothetical protein